MPAISEQSDPQSCDEVQTATDYLVANWMALSAVEREILTALVQRWLHSPPPRMRASALRLVPKPTPC